MHGYTIAFDLDGTLVETAPDLVNATNHVLGLVGLAPVTLPEIRDRISFGARAMIVEALRLRGRAHTDDEVDRLLDRFLAHYSDNIAVASHPYPGLEAALDLLAEGGAILAVCTNKQERLSRQLLDALGLASRFAAIAGRDTLPVFKPHPEHLTGAIRMAGGDPARAVMVGDSETDVKTARAAAIPVIGVPFGYTDTPMHALGPDVLISHYSELPGAIAALANR